MNLAGNISEWVDWEGDTPALERAPLCQSDAEIELKSATSFCPDLALDDYWPLSDNLSSDHGLGNLITSSQYTQGIASRGGHWFDENKAGLYKLNLNNTRTTSHDHTGFRCVLRLP